MITIVEIKKLIAVAKEYDSNAKSFIKFVDKEKCGEWFSFYTDEFFKQVSKITDIDDNVFADCIFDDNPNIANTPVIENADGNLIWNNTFGFENYGLWRILQNIAEVV